MEQDFLRLNPKLILVNHIGMGNLPPNLTSFGSRITRWHELDIITSGNGTDHIDGTDWPVTGGDLFYRTPGMHNRHDLPFNCYFFVFDPYYDPSHTDAYEKDIVDLGNDLPVCDTAPIAPFASATSPYLGKAKDPGKLAETARQILLEFSGARSNPLTLKILFMQLLNEIYTQVSAPEAELPCSGYPQYWMLIRDLKDWIKLHPTEDLSMESMARRLGVSYSFFSRLFKAVTGEAYSAYAVRTRLDYVKLQLMDTSKSISEIALDCGYSNPNYLYILFRREIGCTPMEYRIRNSRRI